MAWIENSTSRDNSDAEKQLQEQKRLAEQKEKSRPPESEQDARLKMGLWVLVGDFKWKMTGQATEWKTRLETLKEKEWFLNSLSTENLWGYSWLINGVKDSIQAWEMKFDTAKTNSALKTDTVEAYSELLNRRLIVLPKLEYMLQSWQRWENIRNDASMRQFFITPEGEYMLALARGENPKDTEAKYTLAKARELKKYIPKGELHAQPLYEQLKGTKYESIANQEKMNITETAWKKYISEVGNELLGTDSLAIMAISGPVWWALAKAVQWERAVAITQNSINAVNKSGIAKTLVPWVRVLWKEASDTIMMKLGKWTLNIAVDATKIVAYTETVRQLGWNDAAKYASYIFLFIPWAKMAFERDMLARLTSHITSETILSWALAKIWPERLKQFFQSQGAWVEANASQVATGAEQAVQEIQELAKTATINTGTTETGKQAIEKWWEKVMEVVKKTQERVGQQVDIKTPKIEDIPRENIKLRTIEQSEFQRLSPEQIASIWPELEKVIGQMRYNSLDRTIDLITLFEKRKVQNPQFTLLDAFQEFKIAKTPEQFLKEWGNCVAMCEQLQRVLGEKGIESHIIRFEAWWLRNTWANEYAWISHSWLIIPRIEHNQQLITFLDPWLLVPKPITFVPWNASEKVMYSWWKWAQVTPNSESQEFSQLLIKPKKWEELIKYPFDPSKTIQNPQDTISKDVMRGLTDFKMVKQSPQWDILALVRIDIVSEKITIQAWRTKQEIPFSEFATAIQNPNTKTLLQATSGLLGEAPPEITRKLQKVMQYTEAYKAQIWNPTNRNQ